MIRFSKELAEWAKYSRRKKSLNKPIFPIKDNLLKEPDAQLLGVVRGRMNGANNLNIYNRANTNNVSTDGSSEENHYDYFEPTMPETPNNDQ